MSSDKLDNLDRKKVIISLSAEQERFFRTRFKYRGERSAWVRDAIETKRAIEDGRLLVLPKAT